MDPTYAPRQAVEDEAGSSSSSISYELVFFGLCCCTSTTGGKKDDKDDFKPPTRHHVVGFGTVPAVPQYTKDSASKCRDSDDNPPSTMRWWMADHPD